MHGFQAVINRVTRHTPGLPRVTEQVGQGLANAAQGDTEVALERCGALLTGMTPANHMPELGRWTPGSLSTMRQRERTPALS
jgi:hypothetical protein